MNDIILDDGYDLEVFDGDLFVGESREQRTVLLLATAQGDWRQRPLAGINIHAYINAPASAATRNALAGTIRLQMDADGLNPGLIEVGQDFKISIQ